MARPRKQTVDYFPHFVGTDSKTKFILENTWKNDGYAFWFKLLELLGRSDGHYYDCSTGANWIYLTSLTFVSKEMATEILDTLAEIGNIDRDLWQKHRIIWCQQFVDNLQQVYSKRSVQIPHKPIVEDQEPEPEKVKNKELEEPVEVKKKTKKKRLVLTAAQQDLFEKFYSAYPKKQDRASAEKAWAKIEPQPDEEMTEKIVKSVELSKKFDSRFREKQFTPLPASWLNAKGFLNEFAQEQEGGNKTYDYRSEFASSSPAGFKPSGGFKSER